MWECACMKHCTVCLNIWRVAQRTDSDCFWTAELINEKKIISLLATNEQPVSWTGSCLIKALIWWLMFSALSGLVVLSFECIAFCVLYGNPQRSDLMARCMWCAHIFPICMIKTKEKHVHFFGHAGNWDQTMTKEILRVSPVLYYFWHKTPIHYFRLHFFSLASEWKDLCVILRKKGTQSIGILGLSR